jgi:hypothetical protein
MPSRKKLEPTLHCLHYLVVIWKLLAPQTFFQRSKQMEVLWCQESGLYGRCFNTSNFRARSVPTVCKAVWGQALLWSNNTLFERSPRCFDCIAGFTLFTNMSLYRALVTVWPFSWKCTNIRPLTAQKTVSTTFPAEACVLNFLLARDDGCFHCINCLLLSDS